jgi:hypothetical protein
MGRRACAAMVSLAVGTIGLVPVLAPSVGDAADGGPAGTGEPAATLEFAVTPKRLPPPGTRAETMTIGIEENATLTEGFPTGMTTATVGLDRSISLEPRGLPVCRWPGVEGGIQIASAGDECPHAVVGTVEGSLFFDYPENTPIRTFGKGKVYNGGVRRGVTYLLLEIPFGAPLSAALRLVVPVRPARHGRIGSEATITVPRIADGYGLLTSLRIEVGRTVSRQKGPAGYVIAECRDRKLVASLSVVLGGETQGEGQEVVRSCGARASASQK